MVNVGGIWWMRWRGCTDDAVDRFLLRVLAGQQIWQTFEPWHGLDELRANAVHYVGQFLERRGEIHLDKQTQTHIVEKKIVEQTGGKDFQGQNHYIH